MKIYFGLPSLDYLRQKNPFAKRTAFKHFSRVHWALCGLAPALLRLFSPSDSMLPCGHTTPGFPQVIPSARMFSKCIYFAHTSNPRSPRSSISSPADLPGLSQSRFKGFFPICSQWSTHLCSLLSLPECLVTVCIRVFQPLAWKLPKGKGQAYSLLCQWEQRMLGMEVSTQEMHAEWLHDTWQVQLSKILSQHCNEDMYLLEPVFQCQFIKSRRIKVIQSKARANVT